MQKQAKQIKQEDQENDGNYASTGSGKGINVSVQNITFCGIKYAISTIGVQVIGMPASGELAFEDLVRSEFGELANVEDELFVGRLSCQCQLVEFV